MKKDFKFQLKNLEGNSIKDENNEIVTAKKIALNVLDAIDPEEMKIPIEKKLHKYELMIRINKGGTVEMDEKDIALLKDLIAKFWGPLIIGRMYEFLKI